MVKVRTQVMSIAGFDPSGGAGLLADIKTFEQLQVYGFGVMTANTWQDDAEVKDVEWIPVDKILKQIDVITDKFDITWYKLGILKDAQMLNDIITHIRNKKPAARFVWDPVLASSSGYEFFSGGNSHDWLGQVDIITPNVPEFGVLAGDQESAVEISKKTSIYLKGGHDTQSPGRDVLYTKGKRYVLNPKIKNLSAKHGSGCIFSSALCANLARGFNLHKAALRSKTYVERALASNNSLLAWHKT